MKHTTVILGLFCSLGLPCLVVGGFVTSPPDKNWNQAIRHNVGSGSDGGNWWLGSSPQPTVTTRLNSILRRRRNTADHSLSRVCLALTTTTTQLYNSKRHTGPGDTSSNQKTHKAPPALNIGLIGQSIANQALIGITIWTGGPGYQILTQQADFTPFAIILGVVGLVPLLALSRSIETSESYLVSGLNLSTNMAVLRLFGPTPQPISAFLASAVMASLTGVVEETTFRGQLTQVFANRFGDGDIFLGAFLSTLLFAALHTNPGSFFKGGDAALDNIVLLVLQFVNGAIFASLYLVTGNLAVPIIAHVLYDLYTFYKTHLIDVAGQMEYANKESLMPKFSSRVVEQKWITERGEDFVNGVQKSFYLMDTNRDGTLDRKELRVALFSYGINLSKLQSEAVTNSADQDSSGTIDLDEFLEFVGPTGSTRKAVRNTLLGPF